MKCLKNFERNWKRQTPKRWKVIRNIAAATTIAVPAAWGTVALMPNITFPEWVGAIIGASVLLSGFITGYAGQKNVPDEKVIATAKEEIKEIKKEMNETVNKDIPADNKT